MTTPNRSLSTYMEPVAIDRDSITAFEEALEADRIRSQQEAREAGRIAVSAARTTTARLHGRTATIVKRAIPDIPSNDDIRRRAQTGSWRPGRSQKPLVAADTDIDEHLAIGHQTPVSGEEISLMLAEAREDIEAVNDVLHHQNLDVESGEQPAITVNEIDPVTQTPQIFVV